MNGPDLPAVINAEIDAEKAGEVFPKFPVFSTGREAQAIENKNFPEIPGFPADFERVQSGDDFTASEPPRAHAINKDARAKSILSENSGKTGNPYYSNTKGGKKPGKPGISGKTLSKEESEDLIALFEERAAIREYEGGFGRPTAASLALEDSINELTNWSDDPCLRQEAMDQLRRAGIHQPELFPAKEIADAPF